MTQNEFGHETNSNRSSMKLSFHPYVDSRIRTSDMAWASNLRQAALGLRGGLEVKFIGPPCGLAALAIPPRLHAPLHVFPSPLLGS